MCVCNCVYIYTYNSFVFPPIYFFQSSILINNLDFGCEIFWEEATFLIKSQIEWSSHVIGRSCSVNKIIDDNSAKWRWSILYSFVGRLQLVSDNIERWGSISYIRFLFVFRNAKILYFDIYELLIVNYVALREKG